VRESADKPSLFPLTLETPRLILRELSLGDCADAGALDGDPEVVRYMSMGVMDEDGTRVYIERSMISARHSPREVFDLAITRKDEGRYLGRAGLHVTRPEHREAMLWFSVRRDLWGQGLATEASAAMLALAFETLGLHRVWGDCDPRNVGSMRVMEKLGMRREGRLRENWWLDDEWCDSLVYAVLEHEWRDRESSPDGL
jgi:ribosomal-protein-alanine N-acetyltransferase